MCYCMTGRAVWGSIPFEGDSIDLIEERDNSKAESGILIARLEE